MRVVVSLNTNEMQNPADRNFKFMSDTTFLQTRKSEVEEVFTHTHTTMLCMYQLADTTLNNFKGNLDKELISFAEIGAKRFIEVNGSIIRVNLSMFGKGPIRWETCLGV